MYNDIGEKETEAGIKTEEISDQMDAEIIDKMTDKTEDKIIIEGQFSADINFSMQQNYVPVIRNLVIKNVSEEILNNLVLKITFEPSFAREYSYNIGRLESGASVEINPVRIILSTEYLFSLTERIVGIMEIKVLSGDIDGDADGKVVGGCHKEIDVLAYDQWSGLYVMPEMIAAFVTPNHPVISEILSRASEILKGWNASPSFSGYQMQNPNHVKLQMGAIYAALHGEHVVYHNPPASYEERGQRIRMPHVLTNQKQGTCLDLSILYASCLEAAGIFPLLVFIKGHAFAGAWLEEQTFSDCAVDDISALKKRMAEGAEEIILVECTDFVEGKGINFETAIKHAGDHLVQEDDFTYAVDIRRCRVSGIRPIPMKLEQADTFGYRGEGLQNGSMSGSEISTEIPREINNNLNDRMIQKEEQPNRMKVWERKLLDLSLRNMLLNFRVTKNMIQLMVSDLGALEDCLSNGEEFLVREIPAEWNGTTKDSKIYEIENEKDLITSIAGEELKNHRIRTFQKAEELDQSLKNLHRAARVSMEENGSNTLYLAIGFLRWYESEVSEKARYAPLVLIPVELVRNFRNKGYVIRGREEETQINITLLEYLKQDHGIEIKGLDPLPLDDHGIDLPLIFHMIRQGVMEKRRWDIENMAFIGLFSFGQFVMWNDLNNRSEDLLKNRIVRSLMEGRMISETEAGTGAIESGIDTAESSISTEQLEKQIQTEDKKDLAVPLSADSSQMTAIVGAAGGQSFVLHGPPGTGKSQTITNMIANALYQGKSVLFVAEKMAALTVVKNRLDQIGLSPFCLELHSNKTNKTAVLNQLNEALEVGRIKNPEDYQATAEKIKEVREQLSYIMDAVHCKREYGCSLYEAISLYEQNIDQKDVIRFSKEQINDLTGDRIQQWLEIINKYESAASITGTYNHSPWVGYEGTEYSIEIKDSLNKELPEKENLLKQTEADILWLVNWSGITSGGNRDTVEKLIQLSDILKDPAPVLDSFILSAHYGMILEQMSDLLNTGLSYSRLQTEFLSGYDPQILQYPVENAMLRYKQAQGSFVLSRMMKMSKLVKELRPYAKDRSLVTKETLPAIYDQLNQMIQMQNKMNNAPMEVTSLADGIYAGINTDWSRLKAAVEKSSRLHDIIVALPLNNREALLQKFVSGKSAQGNAIRGTSAPDNSTSGIPASENEVTECADRIAAAICTLDEMTGKYHINLAQEESSSQWITDAADTFARYHKSMDTFKEWIHFNNVEQQINEQGLSQLVEAYHDGTVRIDTMKSAVLCNLYYGLCVKTIISDEKLNHFQGSRMEYMIAEYDSLIEKFRNLTVQELVARLSAKVPGSNAQSASTSEMGILKKAIKSNGRMMSIRKLFNQIPTLLRILSPCMLMSPISVAQYIDPNFPKFDLVIFDEASQLETSEAVGTIARGENVVVVGDPKQLPPTSFFSSNRIDEENSEYEDLESLLDDCLAISMPQEYLKWHYRSRHESLIAYSNAKYYDNKLYTFPSPNDLVSEVRLVPLDGMYDKGKTKQNKAEAEAVVAEIIRRLQDEKFRKDSIGVVTFSSVQQNLIEDMLMEEFAKNPELADIDAQSKEPIFIKNLENVQGDERDVILFSVGYGPDKDGKVSMNFGPLNQEGGWRRLNVAISRARKSMIVYVVIKPEQIDLSRTRSEGVAGLKGFLEYAKRGKSALTVRAEDRQVNADGMAYEIAGTIEQMGYDVRTNIGNSRYKLDIGIVHPENPEVYLLGILLDGENSRETGSVKDSYILQPGVLKGLGWNVMRIWALDWMDNAKKQSEEIERKIKELLEQEKTGISADEAEGSNGNRPPVFEKISEENMPQGAKRPYQSAALVKQGSSEDFYHPESQKVIRQMAVQILADEAPVSKKLMMRKILNAWDITRSGSRIENVFMSAMKEVQKTETVEGENVYYWLVDQQPEEYNIYRTEDQFGNYRSMDEIPVQEILCAVIEVLTEQVGLSREDLVKETAKKFGYTRLGTVIEKAVNGAVSCGLEWGKIMESGEKINRVR